MPRKYLYHLKINFLQSKFRHRIKAFWYVILAFPKINKYNVPSIPITPNSLPNKVDYTNESR